ncbi:gliding motility-associated C-terminal domain-containing protein [Sanyastnella coralliicola]|uniref:T9SS type B sorting domain-containing protein n=1 Tax=Sanyastnella coralliicola TaxID=3069118 RepID=UPI0027BB0453|nr:gliding motility-associated C-terminal domain-containing protein [Longitalea sp. SCSIO 12813]
MKKCLFLGACFSFLICSVFGQTFPILWDDQENVSVDYAAQTMSKTSADGWDAGAFSNNKIPTNTDGSVEYVLQSEAAMRAFGFNKNNPNTSQNSISYSFQFDGAGLYIVERGRNMGSFGRTGTGAVLKIERVGSDIIYSRNGIVLRTVASNSADELHVDVALFAQGATFNGAVMSVDHDPIPTPGLDVTVAVQPLSENQSTTITLTPNNGVGPYQVYWGDEYLTFSEFTGYLGALPAWVNYAGIKHNEIFTGENLSYEVNVSGYQPFRIEDANGDILEDSVFVSDDFISRSLRGVDQVGQTFTRTTQNPNAFECSFWNGITTFSNVEVTFKVSDASHKTVYGFWPEGDNFSATGSHLKYGVVIENGQLKSRSNGSENVLSAGVTNASVVGLVKNQLSLEISLDGSTVGSVSVPSNSYFTEGVFIGDDDESIEFIHHSIPHVTRPKIPQISRDLYHCGRPADLGGLTLASFAPVENEYFNLHDLNGNQLYTSEVGDFSVLPSDIYLARYISGTAIKETPVALGTYIQWTPSSLSNATVSNYSTGYVKNNTGLETVLNSDYRFESHDDMYIEANFVCSTDPYSSIEVAIRDDDEVIYELVLLPGIQVVKMNYKDENGANKNKTFFNRNIGRKGRAVLYRKGNEINLYFSGQHGAEITFATVSMPSSIDGKLRPEITLGTTNDAVHSVSSNATCNPSSFRIVQADHLIGGNISLNQENHAVSLQSQSESIPMNMMHALPGDSSPMEVMWYNDYDSLYMMLSANSFGEVSLDSVKVGAMDDYVPATGHVINVEDNTLYIMAEPKKEVQHCYPELEFALYFSPNGDGVYDTFKIVGSENFQNYFLRVRNQMNQVVFETYDQNIAWDGTSTLTAQTVTPGLYFYELNYDGQVGHGQFIVKE